MSMHELLRMTLMRSSSEHLDFFFFSGLEAVEPLTLK